MYLSIELQSFAVYILSTLYRNSESATSAGLKYFLLGSLASCFILLGSGIIYTYTGLTNLESIYNLISVTGPISHITLGIALGFIFIFSGFLLKVSAAPLHNWAPDVYDESPTIVTIWLTIMPKISILIFILEIFTQITSLNPILESLNTVGLNTITNLLLISSLISLIIGTVVGLAQTKIKRLLAYSTISHIGFILLALAINSKQSIDSFIFYIIQYTLTNLNTFLILLAIGYILNYKTIIIKGSEKDIKLISELKGLFFSNPILSLSLTICLLSMAGTPPLLGFFSKQFVLYSAIENGYYFMAISGILVSIISASYYLRIIRILHTEIEFNNSLNDETNTTVGINNIHSLLISSLTLLISFFIIKPSILLKSTQLLSLSLYST
jgi:NADH-ubiquinone oxidoreductase chain 2